MSPPEWTSDFTIALELYREIVQLSGLTDNGYPKLDRLEMVFNENDFIVDSRNNLISYITALHTADCKLRQEKMNG